MKMIKAILCLPLVLNRLLQKLLLLLNPTLLLIIMASAIFLGEILVMVILDQIPPMAENWQPVVDATILMLLLTPFYLYLYRPFWAERQLQERQIRHLSQQLLTTAEAERKRLAHEIHDQCGQTLTALQFGLQTLKKQIPVEEASILGRTDYLMQIVAQLGDELRDLTTRLRPAVLDELGLVAALDWQLETFRKNYSEIHITWRLVRRSDLDSRLDPIYAEAIFRICQEALTNIVRHASASEVLVHLSLEKGGLELKIEDNGVGFDLEKSLDYRDNGAGFGLLGMRERVRMAKGTFRIETKPGQGTRVLASFPLAMEGTA